MLLKTIIHLLKISDMPQICATVPQPTIDFINARAKDKKIHFSNEVSIILQEFHEKEEAKKDKEAHVKK